LSPIVGSLLADLIVEGKSPLPLEPFRADRFNEGPVAAHPGAAS
jgi:glycine/D-amino acid oxidase-like deaminating enzyme